MANQTTYIKLLRPFLLAVFLLGFCMPGECYALAWEWSAMPGRERVIITLDAPSPWSVTRVGTQTLLLKLGNSSANLEGAGSPGPNNLFSKAEAAPDGLFLLTNTNAFGYMVAREGDNKIRIDFFEDAIGARWTPPANQPDNPVSLDMAPNQASAQNQPQTQAQAAAPAGESQNVPPRPRTQIDSLIEAQNQMNTPAQNVTSQQPQNTQNQNPAAQIPVQTPAQNTTIPARQMPDTPAVPQAAATPNTAPNAPDTGGAQTYVVPPDPANQQNSGIVETSIAGSLKDIPSPAEGSQQPNAEPENIQITQLPVNTQRPQIIEQPQAQAESQANGQGNGYMFTPINPTSPTGNQPGGHVPDTTSGVQVPISGGQATAPAYPDTASQQAGQTQPPAVSMPAGQGGQTIDINQSDRELVMRVPGPPGEAGVDPSIEQQVQYDEHGNPIEPPPSVPELIRQAEALVNAANYADALTLLQELKLRPDLTSEEMEDVLYLISDATFGMGANDFPTHGDQILGTAEEALNSNLQSNRVPSMMLRLGYVNLKMGNIQEAEAYFNLLKRHHPNDENIPLIYYYWGDYFFQEENYQQAADQFQYIVQNYPDSRFVREASVALARSLYNLGYYDQAFQIVDYIERRWPHYYMEYPPILAMIADASFNMGKYADARTRYWLYYNLAPSGPEAPHILTRIGDIYLEEKNMKAARQVYEEAARRFPNEDDGLVAQMRLAEEGIYDAPSIGDMFNVFDRPYSELPLQTYSRIVNEHPDSELAPLAQLKLSMWYLWNNRFNEALAEATVFAEKYPDHPLLPKAREVALNAFNGLTAASVTNQEYDRILLAWDKFPIIQGQEDVLGSESRLALAYSEWNSQRVSNALNTLEPFFRGTKDFTYGEPALNLALTILVDNQQWQAVADMYRKVEMWELTPDTQRQLDYAMALAAENLKRYDQAAVLWDSLHHNPNLPPDQKIYMFYFLAKAAERNQDMEQAYYLGRDALKGLSEMAEENPEKADKPKIKDLLAMLMNITEGAGRLQEALDWQQQYSQYVSPDDTDYPAMRYRLGQLYRQSGDLARWAVVMQELVDLDPDSLYGRMAASELRSSSLTNEITSFLPQGSSM